MDLSPCTGNVELRTKDDIALAKRGDKSAFERLIRKNDVSLYRIAKGILKHEQDMEDAYQETLIKAYRGIVKLKKDEYFKTWLLRIMINECKMMLRKKKRAGFTTEVLAHEIIAEDDYEKMELWDAVQSLGEELRLTVILFYYEEMMQNDIAEMLGIPVGTVKSRLSRARDSLREALMIKL